ncbi:MAG: ABC-type transport auxiliary lipoprotein family protein [Pseudomonadota bacterium]
MNRPWPSLRWGYLILAAGLSSCSVLPESSPHDIYRLPPSSVTASEGEGSELALRINTPSADALLSSTRIVVIPDGNRVSVYQGVRWRSPAPVLWRDHLLEAFQNDGRIVRLSSSAERLRADIEIGGILQAFQTEYRAGVPEVVIRLDARLVESTGKRILASRRFVIKEAVNSTRVPDVVAAFGRASDAMAKALIDWTLLHAK